MNYWLLKVLQDEFNNILNKREDKYIVFNNQSQLGDVIIIHKDKYIVGVFQVSHINKISNVRYELYFTNECYQDYLIKDVIVKIKPKKSITLVTLNKYLKGDTNILASIDSNLAQIITESCYNYEPEINDKLNVIEEVTEESTQEESSSSKSSKSSNNNVANKNKKIIKINKKQPIKVESESSGESNNSEEDTGEDSNNSNDDDNDDNDSNSDSNSNSDSDSDSDSDNIKFDFSDTKKLSGNLIPILMIPCNTFNKKKSVNPQRDFLDHFQDCCDCQQINNNILDLRYILLKHTYNLEYKEVTFEDLETEYDNFDKLEAYKWKKIPKRTTIIMNYIKDDTKYNKCIILVIYITKK